MAEQARGVGRIGTHRRLERTDRVVTKGPPSAANARGGCAWVRHREARQSGTLRAHRATSAATSPWPSWSPGAQGGIVAPRVAGARTCRHGGTRKWFCHRPQVDYSSAGGGSVEPRAILGQIPKSIRGTPRNATASNTRPRRRFRGMFQGDARWSGTSRANGAGVGPIFGGRVESGAGCPRCSRRAAPPTTQTRRGHPGAAQAEAAVATFGPGGAVEPNGWVRPRLLRQPDPEVFRSCG